MEGHKKNPVVTLTPPTMANKGPNFSNNKVSEWTCQAQRKFVNVKSEESELDPVNSSTKRRRTASVTIRSPPPSTDGSPEVELSPSVGVWRENAVGQKAKELLEAIEHHYPTTFQGLSIRGKPIWLKMLTELSLLIKRFMETSVDAMTEEHITSFEDDLNEYEGFGFDLSWAGKRLDMVKRLKFGNEALTTEWVSLEESLDPLNATIGWRWKQLMEAHDAWKNAELEYDNAVKAREKKAEEMALEFGPEFYRVLKGNLGFGMLPEY